MNHPYFPTARRPLRRTSQLLPLEQRFMFDGAVADAAHAAQVHDAAAAAAAVPPAVLVRAAEPAKDEGKKEVVLVDTSLANYKTLEAGVRAGVGIVEFDGNQDGLAQIAKWAATDGGYDAIHILSHGAEGVVDLGSTQLSSATLNSSTVQAELAQLGRALTSDGDLLLYGCDVGAGNGSALLAGLAQATGADVAASTDTTGAARLGGNWTLEAHSGAIEARELALAQYDGTLQVVPFVYGVDGDDNTPVTTITKTVSSRTITFSGSMMYISNWGDATDGLDPQTGGFQRSLTVAIQAGYSFDISSFKAYSFDGALTFNLIRADGSSDSFTQTGVSTSGNLATINSFNKSLGDIRSVTITTTDAAVFQNFDITDVKALGPTAAVNSAALSADTGASGTDFITRTAAQTITGTLSSALDAGAHVEVSYNNGSSWTTASMTDSTHWSISTTLAGSNTFQARVTDSNGASSTAYQHTYTLDTIAPVITISNLALSPDTGISSTDFITNTANQTVSATLSGTLSAGEIVYGSTDNGATWTDITSKVSGTALSWNSAVLSGSNTLMVKVSDTAGNDAPITSHSYTLDTQAPLTTIATLKFSSDTGTSNTDFVTNDPAQTISGTLSANLAAGETVYVSINNGATWTAASATVGNINWSLAGITLTGNNTLRVKVTDLAGNDATVRSQVYTYDTTAPTTTFSGLAFSADTGTAGDFITKTAAQTITATLSTGLTAGDILYGSLDNGSTWSDISSKVSGTALSWNGVTLTTSSTLQLKVADAAGNESAIRSQGYTLDQSAPATPAAPTLDSDSGVSASDRITNDTTPTLSGTAESGSTVTIYDGATMLGTAVATGGSWSYTTTALSSTSHTFSVTATDVAGNVSSASAGTVVSIDTTAPTVSSVAVPADGTYYTGDPLSFTVNFGETVFVDTTGGTPRLAITIGATTRYATYVSGSGSSALVFSYSVVNGDIDSNGIAVNALQVNGGTLRDTAGNDATLTLNSVSSTVNVDVDGSSPSITNISASTPNGAYGDGATITITLDFSTAVTVDTTGGTPLLSLDGGGTAVYTGGSGSTTLTFSYTVGAGQNSADLDAASTSALSLNGATIVETGGAHRNASVVLLTPGSAGSLGANKAIVIDTTAPSVTIASGGLSDDTGNLNNDRITNHTAQDLQGTLSAGLGAGETVLVSLDSGATWHQAAITGGTNWKLAGQTLTVGTGAFLVKVTDAAGNDGTVASYSYTVDQTAPTLTLGGLSLSADTGVSHTDFITNTSAQIVSATLSGAPAAGDVVYGSLDNGATWSNITSKVSGTTLTWNGVTLVSSNTLKLKVSDAAGNDGAITAQAYTLDTTGPTTTIASVVFSNDSGASKTDFITKTATQDISGTLSANLGADEVVLVSLDNGGSWQTASTTVGTPGWQLSGQTLTASDTLLVKVSDTAGNDANILSQAYVYDTAASVPTIDALTTVSLTPVLSGHATLTAGETMTVAVGGATYDVVPVAGAWSLDLATAVPVSGALTLVLNNQYNVTATVTDLAGNTASDATTGELIVGSIAPPVPPPPTTSVSGITLSNDSGASSTDFITNVAQQTISGGLSAPLLGGESVQVSVDGGTNWRSASASGNSWSLNATLSGSNTILVRVIGSGGVGAAAGHAYTLDTSAPATPAVDAQSGSTLAPVLSGAATLADGETLNVTVGGASYAVGVSGGRWSLDLASATPASGALLLAAGNSYSVVATITDLAGNQSSASNGLTIAALPQVTGAALSADSGASSSDFITNVAAQTVSGTLSAPLAAGQTVEVSVDNGATWTNASTSASSWSASVTLSGSNTLLARVTSAAGSSSPYSHAYVLDNTAPVAAPANAVVTTGGNVSGTLSAPLAAGDTLLASRDGGATWTVIASSGQTWTLSSDGASSVQLQVRDLAGNAGATLTVNTAQTPEPPVTTDPPLPPALPETPPVQPVPPILPVAPINPGAPATVAGTPADAPVAGNGAGSGQPAAPLVLPQTSVGGDIATSWPGQTPPTVLDTLPSSVVLQAPDFDRAPLNNSFQIVALPALQGGGTLVAYNPIADVRSTSGERISVQVGSDAFAQSGSNANVELTAQSADGSPLPGWLRFDGRTARFEGTPPAGFEGTLNFKVIARDSQGRVATQVFKIVISKDGAKSSWHGEPAEPAGRAGLNEQLRNARSAGMARLAALSS